MEELRAVTPDLEVEEIDVAERPAVAVRYGVMATPALAIDGRLEFVGVPGREALRERLRAAAERGASGGAR